MTSTSTEPKADKLIVSNDGALRKKYGADGLAAIKEAIEDMITSDATQYIRTRYVALDDDQAMATAGAAAVNDSTDQPANKAAIDAIYLAFDKPDYLMILGSVDIVPHQDLLNPLYSPLHGELDHVVPSDLPYACDAPHSQAMSDFIAPSRVVGRLPDLTGSSEAADFVAVIHHAIEAVAAPAGAPQPLGITAKAWQGSTNQSLQVLFGPAVVAHASPEEGPHWTTPLLDARIHFINCHGFPNHPQFHGEPENYPVAHDATWLTNKIAKGTIAAVECCYGAALYDPAKSNGQMSIGNTYLVCGAAAYVGSTTMSYAPPGTNDYADLICRFFVEEVMAGRSTGSAFLRARLRYLNESRRTDPVDLKTLAQFVLLGDPSLHPIIPAQGPSSARPSTGAGQAIALARRGRREAARKEATRIETSHPVSDTAIDVPADMHSKLSEYIDKAGLKTITLKSFATAIGRGGRARAHGSATPPEPRRVHVVLGERTDLAHSERPRYPVAVVAQEEGGALVHVETIYGKGERARAGW